MTKLEQYWVSGLAVGGAAIVTLLLLRHTASVAGASTAPTPVDVPPPTPPQNTFDIPPYPPIDLGNITFNTTPPAPAPGCDCGCENAGNNQFIGQFQDMVNQYDAGLQNIEQMYANAILGQVNNFNIISPWGTGFGYTG